VVGALAKAGAIISLMMADRSGRGRGAFRSRPRRAPRPCPHKRINRAALVLAGRARHAVLAATIEWRRWRQELSARWVAGRPMADARRAGRSAGSAVGRWPEVAGGLAIDATAMQANRTPPRRRAGERATFLLAATMARESGRPGREGAGQRRLVSAPPSASSRRTADEAALLGYSPQFVDRLLADLKH